MVSVWREVSMRHINGEKCQLSDIDCQSVL